MFESEDTRVGLSTLLPKSRLKELYTDALRMRLVLDEKISMKLRGQHEIGGFYIGGMGEEVHGTATAQVWDAMGLAVGESAAEQLALFLHYRSDSLLDAALRLQGEEGGGVLDQLRQQAARATDTNAGGRQMVMHVSAGSGCTAQSERFGNAAWEGVWLRHGLEAENAGACLCRHPWKWNHLVQRLP